MPRIKLKPRDGFTVRDPITKERLPPEGAHVVASSYWARRIACGDAVRVDDEVKPLPKPQPESEVDA